MNVVENKGAVVFHVKLAIFIGKLFKQSFRVDIDLLVHCHELHYLVHLNVLLNPVLLQW